MRCTKWAVFGCAVTQAIMGAATANESTTWSGVVSRSPPKQSGLGSGKLDQAPAIKALDRVTFAVEGAESSHGRDVRIWRLNQPGPQGPMQVTEAAAIDVGGADRFDVVQNRIIGRSYLAQLYRRYQEWPDAIAAYNWGRSNLDTWIKAGRPTDKLLAGVAGYTMRVLRDSGLCKGTETKNLLRSAVFDGDRPEFRPAMSAIFKNPLFARFERDAGVSIGHRYDDCARVLSGSLETGPVRPRGPVQSPFQQQAASARSTWMITIRHLGCSATSDSPWRCK